MENKELALLILENWDLVFIYGLKVLYTLDKRLSKMETLFEAHEKKMVRT